MYLNPIGEDTLVLCDGCGYAANRQVAAARLPAAAAEAALPSELVATPDTPTIEALAELLQVPTARTAKAVFFMAAIAGKEGEEDRERFVFAVVRGDSELNETKLANAIGARDPAAGPRGGDSRRRGGTGIRLAGGSAGRRPAAGGGRVDPRSRPNLVAGANKPGYHLRNTNYGRDYTATQVVDLVLARDGDACARCGGTLRTSRGVEVGNIFKLGTRYNGCLGRRIPGQRRQQQAGHHGIVRHRQRAAAVLRHRGATTTSAASAFPISVAARTTCRAWHCCSGRRKSLRRPSACIKRHGRKAWKCCWTTATPRPA